MQDEPLPRLSEGVGAVDLPATDGAAVEPRGVAVSAPAAMKERPLPSPIRSLSSMMIGSPLPLPKMDAAFSSSAPSSAVAKLAEPELPLPRPAFCLSQSALRVARFSSSILLRAASFSGVAYLHDLSMCPRALSGVPSGHISQSRMSLFHAGPLALDCQV